MTMQATGGAGEQRVRQSNGTGSPHPSSSPPALPLSIAAHPTVSWHAMQRAQKTIADFMQSYLFVFHAPDLVQQADEVEGEGGGGVSNLTAALTSPVPPSPATLSLLFRALPLLTFVEATIYQMDEENERHNADRRDGVGEASPSKGSCAVEGEHGRDGRKRRRTDKTRARLATSPFQEPVVDEPCAAASTPPSAAASADQEEPPMELPADAATYSSPSYEVLLAVLRSEGLLTPRVHDELRRGLLYWQLEREVCERMLSIQRHRRQPAAPGPSPSLSLTDVHLCSSCKSFDYRVLHLLLYGLTGRPVDERVWRAMRLNERLVDLHDDLCDYEDDVHAHSFNLLRAYAHVYGPVQAPVQISLLIRRLEQQFDGAMGAVPAVFRRAFAAREQAAMRESGARARSGGVQSVWSIPPVIEDEEGWRREVRLAEAQSTDLLA